MPGHSAQSQGKTASSQENTAAVLDPSAFPLPSQGPENNSYHQASLASSPVSCLEVKVQTHFQNPQESLRKRAELSSSGCRKHGSRGAEELRQDARLSREVWLH